jgi:hypothetical protein
MNNYSNDVRQDNKKKTEREEKQMHYLYNIRYTLDS